MGIANGACHARRPFERVHRSRRRALGAFACASLSVAISLTSTSTEFAARADDEDEELAELEANMKRVMETNSGEQTFVRQIGLRSSDKANGVRACAFEVSSLWRVDGARVVDAMTTEWGTIVDPENGAVAKVLGLDGVLYVLSLDATPAQWRVTGN